MTGGDESKGNREMFEAIRRSLFPDQDIDFLTSLMAFVFFVAFVIAVISLKSPKEPVVTPVVEEELELVFADIVVVEPDEPVVKVALKTRFTPDQERLLRIAYEEGEAIGWPETVQAILLQETTAGLNGPIGDLDRGFGRRSYCHMQIKLNAAKDVLRHYDDLGSFATDEELLVKLLTDDRFCIRMGARYFAIMTKLTQTWSEAVLAYNRGPTGAKSGKDPVNYLPGIREKIHTVIRPYQELLMVADSSL